MKPLFTEHFWILFMERGRRSFHMVLRRTESPSQEFLASWVDESLQWPKKSLLLSCEITWTQRCSVTEFLPLPGLDTTPCAGRRPQVTHHFVAMSLSLQAILPPSFWLEYKSKKNCPASQWRRDSFLQTLSPEITNNKPTSGMGYGGSIPGL